MEKAASAASADRFNLSARIGTVKQKMRKK
jgi:hypothetical protein